jgi:hypothetical protein
MHKIICVTPAGRRRYLELLKRSIGRETEIHEWHLWDNCRRNEDRVYLNELARGGPRIKIIRIEGADGTNQSVNRFYRFCNDPEAFYLKVDDDMVYLPGNLSGRLYRQAAAERERYIWWSPLVVNNAICSWLIKHHSQVSIPGQLSCQASYPRGWSDGQFAEFLHGQFLEALENGEVQKFCVPDFEVSLSRFSINCIGFFGQDVLELGEGFCPPECDDEEWISAVLPSLTGRPGRIVGGLIAAHFSYFPQEAGLLRSGILDHYYRIAGLPPPVYEDGNQPPERKFARALRGVKAWASRPSHA